MGLRIPEVAPASLAPALRPRLARLHVWRVFNGKVVWITGASSGIGRSLAFAFHDAGAKLILSARRADDLEEVKRTCGNGSDIHVVPLDLADLDTLPAHGARALAIYGHVDYMVHNAGVALRDRVVDTSIDIDQRIMTVNYFGPVALTKALLPSMLQRRAGCFVVISSLSGKYGGPQLSSYAASKHALHGFFESLRAEVHADGIRITLIVPGFIRTPIVSSAVTGGGGTYGRTLEAHERGMDPAECARRTLKAVARGKEEALVGGLEMYSVYLKRLFPRLLSTLLRHHPMKLRDRLVRMFSRGR